MLFPIVLILVTIPSILFGVSIYLLTPIGLLITLFKGKPSSFMSTWLRGGKISYKLIPIFLVVVVPLGLHFIWWPLGPIFSTWMILYFISRWHSGISRQQRQITEGWEEAANIWDRIESRKEKPLTRDDVLKLIIEHEGPKGLNLSGKNLEEIDLSYRGNKEDFDTEGVLLGEGGKNLIDLHGIVLIGANLKGAYVDSANLTEAILSESNMEHADFSFSRMQSIRMFKVNASGASFINADLQNANLASSNLQQAKLEHANMQEAVLEYANLQGASLSEANLRNANLEYATIHSAYLYKTIIDSNTNLRNVDWGSDYIVGEEKEGSFKAAEDIYRTLEWWYAQAGFRDIASAFAYRKQEARRKSITIDMGKELKYLANP